VFVFLCFGTKSKWLKWLAVMMMIFVCVSLFRPGVKMAEMAEGNDDGGFCLCFFA
jgi:hypothetical protein